MLRVLPPVAVSTTILTASSPLAPAPVREAMAASPLQYGALAVLFALVGGFAVQHRAWIDGRVTLLVASSELLFSGIAGLVAYWLAAKRDNDPLDLMVGALLLGMAGRPMLLAAQRTATSSVLQALVSAFGGPRHEDTPHPEADQRRGRRRDGAAARDSSGHQLAPGEIDSAAPERADRGEPDGS